MLDILQKILIFTAEIWSFTGPLGRVYVRAGPDARLNRVVGKQRTEHTSVLKKVRQAHARLSPLYIPRTMSCGKDALVPTRNASD